MNMWILEAKQRWGRHSACRNFRRALPALLLAYRAAARYAMGGDRSAEAIAKMRGRQWWGRHSACRNFRHGLLALLLACCAAARYAMRGDRSAEAVAKMRGRQRWGRHSVCRNFRHGLLALLLAYPAAAQPSNATQLNDACYAMRGNRSAEAVAKMREAIADPAVRTCAARNLREAGAAAALIDALATGAPDTRIAAARELGLLHDPAALEALGRAALDANPLVASSAIAALGAFEDRAALPYLLKAAALPTLAGVAALEEAARFRDPAVLPPARSVLANGDVASRVIAMTILGDLGDASDLPRLREIAANAELVTARGRGFGFMPAIDPARVARNAIQSIERRQ
jgi:hypothetical protein